MLRRILACALAVLCIGACGIAVAQSTTWSKTTYVVRDLNDVVVGQLSYIQRTGSSGSNVATRILIADGSGHLLVARITATGPDVITVSFASPNAGDTLSVAYGDPTITVSAGSTSFSFSDGEETSDSVRSQAAALLAGTSAEFRDALNAITALASKYNMPDLTPHFAPLLSLFYPTMQPPRTIGTVTRTIVKPFNPQTVPPSGFETAFGSAYYN